MSDVKYNRIKHLVEVDDDILAVFMVSLAGERHIENLSIARMRTLLIASLTMFWLKSKITSKLSTRIWTEIIY
jgi:hypothetical protein